MQNLSLLTSLVGAFGLALVFGYFAERYCKMPALVGYLLAGIAVKFLPWLPTVDQGVTEQLAEVGVILLMMGVGLHFSIRDLWAVKGVAVPGAILQMSTATILGALLAWGFWDWAPANAVLFGVSLSCASTVVVTKALEMGKMTNTPEGRLAIGWLVVEDLVTVVILVLLPPFAAFMLSKGQVDGQAMAKTIFSTLAGVGVFAFLMLGGGRRIFPYVLKRVASTGSRELFTLSVLALALGIAYVAGVFFNVSYALGAFLAGMVMRESRYAKRAATDALPLQDAFSVLFFVSVGMMLDWHIFIEEPWEILSVVAIIMLGNMTVSFGLVLLLRWPLKTALTVAVSLAQVGEFSYIVVAQGISLGLADARIMSLIVGASIITIALNPLLFRAIPFLTNKLVVRWNWARHAASRTTPKVFTAAEPAAPKPVRRGGEAIVIGMDERVPGVVESLLERHYPVVLLSPNSEVDYDVDLSRENIVLITGDPTDPMVLVQARVTTASVVVVTGASVARSRHIAKLVSELNNTLPVVVRVEHFDSEEAFADLSNVTVVSDTLAASYALAGAASEEAENARKKPVESEGLPEDDEPKVGLRTSFENAYPRIVKGLRRHPRAE